MDEQEKWPKLQEKWRKKKEEKKTKEKNKRKKKMQQYKLWITKQQCNELIEHQKTKQSKVPKELGLFYLCGEVHIAIASHH